MVAVFLVHVSGILVAGKGSVTRCMGWPMSSGIAIDVPGWPQQARLALAGVAAVLVLSAVIQSWRAPGTPPTLKRVALATGVAFLVEMAAGLMMLALGPEGFCWSSTPPRPSRCGRSSSRWQCSPGPAAAGAPAQVAQQRSGQPRAGLAG